MTARRAEFTIGQAAGQVGVRPSALRYYERLGLLPPARRSSGQRRYTVDTVDRLHLIRFAKRAGFRLAEISMLLGGTRKGGRATSMAKRWRQLVPGKIAELETEMARLEETRLRLQSLLLCECRQPEQCGRQLQEIVGSSRSTPENADDYDAESTSRHATFVALCSALVCQNHAAGAELAQTGRLDQKCKK